MFQGGTGWVDWINRYKTTEEPLNPHWKNPHTNLAWLLQYSEVQVMTGIWKRLKALNTPFLTIHDELLCRTSDKEKVYGVMKSELAKHFRDFEINVNVKL